MSRFGELGRSRILSNALQFSNGRGSRQKTPFQPFCLWGELEAVSLSRPEEKAEPPRPSRGLVLVAHAVPSQAPVGVTRAAMVPFSGAFLFLHLCIVAWLPFLRVLRNGKACLALALSLLLPANS